MKFPYNPIEDIPRKVQAFHYLVLLSVILRVIIMQNEN